MVGLYILAVCVCAVNATIGDLGAWRWQGRSWPASNKGVLKYGWTRMGDGVNGLLSYSLADIDRRRLTGLPWGEAAAASSLSA